MELLSKAPQTGQSPTKEDLAILDYRNQNIEILPEKRIHMEEVVLRPAKPMQGLSKMEPPILTEVGDNLISLLKQQEYSFAADKVKYFLLKWQEITSDETILDIVKHGLRMNLTGIPNQGHIA